MQAFIEFEQAAMHCARALPPQMLLQLIDEA